MCHEVVRVEKGGIWDLRHQIFRPAKGAPEDVPRPFVPFAAAHS
jgi:hypothetical protein